MVSSVKKREKKRAFFLLLAFAPQMESFLDTVYQVSSERAWWTRQKAFLFVLIFIYVRVSASATYCCWCYCCTPRHIHHGPSTSLLSAPKGKQNSFVFTFSCFEINDRIDEAKIVEIYDLCGNVKWIFALGCRSRLFVLCVVLLFFSQARCGPLIASVVGKDGVWEAKQLHGKASICHVRIT